jgi:hypothetical protein
MRTGMKFGLLFVNRLDEKKLLKILETDAAYFTMIGMLPELWKTLSDEDKAVLWQRVPMVIECQPEQLAQIAIYMTVDQPLLGPLLCKMLLVERGEDPAMLTPGDIATLVGTHVVGAVSPYDPNLFEQLFQDLLGGIVGLSPTGGEADLRRWNIIE